MSQYNRPLIGSVFERKPSSTPSTPSAHFKFAKSGFPAAQHRSKSAFSKGRDALRRSDDSFSRLSEPPTVATVSSYNDQNLQSSGFHIDPGGLNVDSPDWRTQISEENERRVASMTDEEREQERREVEERFGRNIGDILKKARVARKVKEVKEILRKNDSSVEFASHTNDGGLGEGVERQDDTSGTTDDARLRAFQPT